MPSARVGRVGAPASERRGLPDWGWLALLTLVGAALRLYRLDGQSMWLDEISSLRNARVFGAGGLYALAGADQVAPLHSITLWLATLIGGDSAVALRMPSVLAGIATIPATWWAAVRLFGSRRVALVSAGLVAISPFAIWYSQEARMYALLLLCATLYVAIAWPVIERPLRIGELALLTLVTTIGLGMHHYMALIAVSFGLFLLIDGKALKARSWAWAATQIIAALIFSYWMFLTANRIASAAGNAKPEVLLWTPYAFYSFVMGYSFGPSTRELALAGQAAIAAVVHHAPAIAIVALATAAVGLIGLSRALRPAHRGAGVWLLIWLVVPIGLAVAATFVTNIQFNVRYVIVSYPALIILLGLGAGARDRPADTHRWRQGVATAGLIVLAACMLIADANLYRDTAYGKDDVRGLAAYMKQHPSSATMVVDNDLVIKGLDYYGVTLPAGPLQANYRSASDTPEQVWRRFIQAPLPADGNVSLIEYRSWETDPAAYLQSHLDAEATLVQVHRWPGIELRQYHFDRRPAAQATRRN